MNPAALANEPLRSTDIGILPESWRVVGLGEALRQAQYGLSVRGQKSGSYPILRMNCQERGRVVFRDLQFVDLDDRTLESYRLNEGDILFNRTNSHELVGRSALFDGSRTAVFASYLLRLATDQSKLLPAFLNFYLASEPAQESLKSFATRGVSQSNISASKLRLLRIPQPPIEEQSAIADVLSKLQATVDRQDRIVGTLKELKAATMAKLFREGLRGEPLKQTEIGEIPERWDVVPLSAVCSLMNYGTSVRCGRDPIGRPVLRIPNVVNEAVDPNDLKFAALEEREARAYELEDGDILFVRTNGNRNFIGRSAVYSGRPGRALFASYLIRVRLKADVLVPKFVQAFLAAQGRRQITDQASAASDGKFNIDTGVLKSLLIPRPPRDEQRAIAAAVSSLDDRLIRAENAAAGRRRLFHAALTALMTGSMRIGDVARTLT